MRAFTREVSRRPSLPVVASLLLALAGPARAPAGETAPEVAPLAGYLASEDWTLRSLAAWEMRKRTETGAVELLAGVLRAEREPLVLGCALASLAGRERKDLVREGGGDLALSLARLGDHANGRVRALARSALARVTGRPEAEPLEVVRRWLATGAALLDLERERLRERRVVAPPAKGVPLAPGERPSYAPTPEPYDWIAGVRRSGLELCVVLDDTGSMGPVIAQAKAGAILLVRRLSTVVPRLRIGLVTYKDSPHVHLALTPDAEAFAKALRKVAASGGGDPEEGVDQGIRAALRQESMGWSRAGRRVLVVIGDAPPHEEAMPRLERHLAAAREDVLYDHPVVVHTVSTDTAGVEHFGRIAFVGGGASVTLTHADRLVDEIVGLTLGAAFQDRVRPWLEEVERIRREGPDR